MWSRFRQVNWNPGPSERRAFARLLAVGIPVIAAVWFVLLFLVTGRWIPAVPFWILAIGEACAFLTYINGPLGKAIHAVWFFLVCVIESVLTTVLLAFVFYGVITPVGLIQRVCRRKFFRKRGDPRLRTYWQPAERINDPRRYYRQF